MYSLFLILFLYTYDHLLPAFYVIGFGCFGAGSGCKTSPSAETRWTSAGMAGTHPPKFFLFCLFFLFLVLILVFVSSITRRRWRWPRWRRRWWWWWWFIILVFPTPLHWQEKTRGGTYERYRQGGSTGENTPHGDSTVDMLWSYGFDVGCYLWTTHVQPGLRGHTKRQG